MQLLERYEKKLLSMTAESTAAQRLSASADARIGDGNCPPHSFFSLFLPPLITPSLLPSLLFFTPSFPSSLQCFEPKACNAISFNLNVEPTSRKEKCHQIDVTIQSSALLMIRPWTLNPLPHLPLHLLLLPSLYLYLFFSLLLHSNLLTATAASMKDETAELRRRLSLKNSEVGGAAEDLMLMTRENLVSHIQFSGMT